MRERGVSQKEGLSESGFVIVSGCVIVCVRECECEREE